MATARSTNDLKFGQGKSLFAITILVLLFLHIPILILIFYSFNDSRFASHWGGFSLKWYYKIIDDDSLWLAVRNTIQVAIVSTIISTILGTLAAIGLHKFNFKFKDFFLNILYLPIIIPEVVMGLSMLILFVLFAIPLGLMTVTIAHITFSISFVVLIVLARLQSFDMTLEEAGADLGATQWQIFWKITFPNISSGIYAGALLALTLSIDDFLISFFTTGPGSTTLPLKIYAMIKFGITPEINAVSTILLISTTLILYFVGYFMNKGKKEGSAFLEI
ncbi:MAG: ABC transporter permease [Bacteroidetes bacterium]|nr:ABC transporter permease [Bacteroidota bacterium]